MQPPDSQVPLTVSVESAAVSTSHPPCRRHRPADVVPIVSALLTLTLLASCSLPFDTPSSAKSAAHAATATSTSPLASETVYWSGGDFLYAVRASDGHVRWKADGTGAPTLADGTLYAAVSLDHAEAHALATTDGTTRWHTTFPGCFNLVGSASPPLLAGGVLYFAVSSHDCAPNGWVYALRASDGSAIWRTPFERDVLPTVALTGGALLVGSSTYPAVDEQEFLTALRPTDGARLWRARLSISPYYLAAEDGVVVVSGFFFGDKLEARRVSDGQRLWITSANRYNDTTLPVIANGLVYVSGQDGYLYALRLQDDAVQSRFAAGTGAGVFAASEPAVVDNIIYWGAGPILYALDAHTGALHHAYHLFPGAEDSTPGQVFFVYSPPAVADGALFVAAQAIAVCGMLHCPEQSVTLHALDVVTGAELWHYTEPEGNGTLPPVVGP